MYIDFSALFWIKHKYERIVYENDQQDATV